MEVLQSVKLRIPGCQVTPDAQYGGVFGLRVHRKTHRPGEAEHGAVGGENNADYLLYSCALCMLDQSREQPAAKPAALPRIGDHQRYLCTWCRPIDDIAPDPDELLDPVDHAGYGEGHVAVIVDVRHRLDPFGRHLEAAAQHALIARFAGKATHERFFERAVVVADRPQEERLTRGESPGAGQVRRILLQPAR